MKNQTKPERQQKGFTSKQNFSPKRDLNSFFLIIKPFNKREGRRGGLQGSVQINREEQSTHAASKKGGGRGRGFAGQQGEGVVEGGAD